MNVSKTAPVNSSARLTGECKRESCEPSLVHLRCGITHVNTTKLADRCIEPQVLLKDLIKSKKNSSSFRNDIYECDLRLLFQHDDLLCNCSAFELPIFDSDGIKKDEIRTYLCENMSDIISVTNELKNNELAFIVYRCKWENDPEKWGFLRLADESEGLKQK